MSFLERIPHDHGVVTYRSPQLHALGVPHAFSTRLGGYSIGPYASLNLGPLEKGGGDDNTTVAANFRRFRATLGLGRHLRVTCRQVHGRAVWSPPAAPVKPADIPEADALVTAHANLMLTIRVADCVPVLLAAESGAVVAAAHAGWRSIVAGVVNETLSVLREEHTVEPGQVVAAIGPCLSVEHFEVGEEVADAFVQAGLADTIDRAPGRKPHIDLRGAVMRQLTSAGIPAERIDHTDRCTWRDADEFFSHRRDQGVTGRMVAAIGVATC